MRLWSFVMSVLGCLLLSQSAFALSCAQPDIIRSLESVKKSETVYYILVGTFTTPPEEGKPRLEQRGGYQAEWQSKPPRIVPSLFNGYALSPKRRHDVELSDYPVNLEISCAGPWCGNLPRSGQTLIAFVEAPQTVQSQGLSDGHGDPNVPILQISPCPGQTFPTTPHGVQVSKVRKCLNRTCQPQTLY